MTADSGDAPRVADVAPSQFRARLAGAGIGLQVGPFAVRLVCTVAEIADALHELYGDYRIVADDSVYSFHIRLQRAFSVRKLARLVRFSVDGRAPHEDMPLAQALAVFEWGLNLVIALRTHSLLLLHAAAVARDDAVLLLPALPGRGKTTLCAALVHGGWRLFSDEFGLIDPSSGSAVPLPRPMPLKNESIAIIRAFAPQAVFGPEIANTRKGTVAHVKAPRDSIARADVPGRPRWIVFPRWQSGAIVELTAMPKAEAFAALATNAFNYEALGATGFDAVTHLAATTQCFNLVYSDLGDALAALESLALRDE